MLSDMLSVLLLAVCCLVQARPPYSGTVWINDKVLIPSDPSSYRRTDNAGTGTRRVWDERQGRKWTNQPVRLFNVSFSEGKSMEVQVHQNDFGSSAARTEAERFGKIIGQIPTGFRWELREVFINKGNAGWSAGSKAININLGFSNQATFYEEILLHEMGHIGLDPRYSSQTAWKNAQSRDGEFISTYGRDNPTREDLAESALVWFISRYRKSRISSSMRSTIEKTIPARLSYIDGLRLDMFPTRSAKGVTETLSTMIPDPAWKDDNTTAEVDWDMLHRKVFSCKGYGCL